LLRLFLLSNPTLFVSSARERLADMMNSHAPHCCTSAAASWSVDAVDVALCCGSDLLASMALPGVWDQKVSHIAARTPILSLHLSATSLPLTHRPLLLAMYSCWMIFSLNSTSLSSPVSAGTAPTPPLTPHCYNFSLNIEPLAHTTSHLINLTPHHSNQISVRNI
jgi:hypothetical protein